VPGFFPMIHPASNHSPHFPSFFLIIIIVIVVVVVVKYSVHISKIAFRLLHVPYTKTSGKYTQETVTKSTMSFNCILNICYIIVKHDESTAIAIVCWCVDACTAECQEYIWKPLWVIFHVCWTKWDEESWQLLLATSS
jgi:hypothetical protein